MGRTEAGTEGQGPEAGEIEEVAAFGPPLIGALGSEKAERKGLRASDVWSLSVRADCSVQESFA